MPSKTLQLLTVAVFATSLTGCGSKPAPETMYFGEPVSRTGTDRDKGTSAVNGTQLAVREINDGEAKPLGRPLAVLLPDNQSKTDATQQTAVRLVTLSSAVALLGGNDSASADRLCRIGQQTRVPVVTSTWLPLQQLGPLGFTIGPAPSTCGRALAKFAASKETTRRTAILTDARSAASTALTAAFIETLGQSHVAFRAEYSDDDRLEQVARQAAATDAGSILLAGRTADVETLRNELQKAGVCPDVVLLFGGEDDPALAQLADNSPDKNDLIWTTPFILDEKNPKSTEFAKKYKEAYSQQPDAVAALAYDATRILALAFDRAKTVRSDRVREELARMQDFDGVTGPLTFDKEQAVERPVWVIHRENKRQVVLRAP